MWDRFIKIISVLVDFPLWLRVFLTVVSIQLLVAGVLFIRYAFKQHENRSSAPSIKAVLINSTLERDTDSAKAAIGHMETFATDGEGALPKPPWLDTGVTDISRDATATQSTAGVTAGDAPKLLQLALAPDAHINGSVNSDPVLPQMARGATPETDESTEETKTELNRSELLVSLSMNWADDFLTAGVTFQNVTDELQIITHIDVNVTKLQGPYAGCCGWVLASAATIELKLPQRLGLATYQLEKPLAIPAHGTLAISIRYYYEYRGRRVGWQNQVL